MTEASRAGESAGALLRAAREKQGLHIAALAAAIKVAPRKLDALENNRWDELPDATFTRALAQTVCRTLKIDARPVLDLLPAVDPAALENVGGHLNMPFSERGGSGDASALGAAIRPMVGAAVLLMVAAGVIYLLPAGWWSGAERTAPAPVLSPAPGAASAADALAASSPASGAEAAATAAGPAFSAAASAPASGPAAGPVATPTASAGVPPVASPTPAPGAAPIAALAAPAAAAVPVGDGPLQLRAVQATWVEARDAGGRLLLSRLVSAGERVALDGALPVRLTIGNAQGTELSFRGQRVDLAPRTRDNVARVELPLSAVPAP